MTLQIFETVTGHERIDFDRKKIRVAMRRMGAEVRKEARRRVGSRAVSQAGSDPGKGTGELQRSIKAKVSRPGFMVKVAPYATESMKAKKAFYPVFLHYGVTGKPRRKDGKAQEKTGRWRIAPRNNYMTDALQARRDSVRNTLKNALQDALIPR